jgi:hypothetical protein
MMTASNSVHVSLASNPAASVSAAVSGWIDTIACLQFVTRHSFLYLALCAFLTWLPIVMTGPASSNPCCMRHWHMEKARKGLAVLLARENHV